jgi:hypothetical protein
MTIAIKALLAEMALATCNVEWHQHMVAGSKVSDGGSDLLNDAAEFMAEGLTNAGVGYHAVIKMKIRSADAGARDLHDCVPRMLDPRFGFFLHADPVRTSIVHRPHG